MQESNIAALSSRLALIAGGSAGIAAATDDSAIELFEEALAVPGADRWSFDLARVQLSPTANGCDGSRRWQTLGSN
jgi:hypothetical protein